MDPREALLRQDAKPANKEVEYFSKIFQKNQPQRLYAKRTLEADLDEEEKRRKKQGQVDHCGVCWKEGVKRGHASIAAFTVIMYTISR